MLLREVDVTIRPPILTCLRIAIASRRARHRDFAHRGIENGVFEGGCQRIGVDGPAVVSAFGRHRLSVGTRVGPGGSDGVEGGGDL